MHKINNLYYLRTARNRHRVAKNRHGAAKNRHFPTETIKIRQVLKYKTMNYKMTFHPDSYREQFTIHNFFTPSLPPVFFGENGQKLHNMHKINNIQILTFVRFGQNGQNGQNRNKTNPMKFIILLIMLCNIFTSAN